MNDDIPPQYSLEPPEYSQTQTETSPLTSADEKVKPKEQIRHFISPTDTLFGISLKYGISVQDLRKANRLYTDEVCNRQFLIIPGAEKSLSDQTVEGKQKILIKRFQINTKCGNYDEARSYMIQNDYDLVKAAEQYNEDLEWERRQGSSSKATMGNSCH
jgi:LysM repeat protein